MRQKKKIYNKKQKKYNSKNIFILTLLTTIIITGIVFSQSKYVISKKNNQILNASKFYLESNELSVDGKENYYNDWDGESKYVLNFELENYEDNLRFNDDDVKYQIKTEIISPNDSEKISTICLINDIEKTEGILNGKTKTENDIKIEINPENSSKIEELVIKVTVETKEPYEKQMTGTFYIKNGNERDYDANLAIKDDYAELLIKTYSNDKDLKIIYDSSKLKIYEDNSSYDFSKDGYFTANLKSHSNYSFKFIKLNNNNSIVLGKDIVLETTK